MQESSSAVHATPARTVSRAGAVRQVFSLFKLRIGFIIMVTALAGFAITPGSAIGGLQLAVLALSVLLASASAGAFNQYVEYESDRFMARTRGRAFASGALPHTPAWLWLMAAMLGVAVCAAWQATNLLAALYVFLGAFFYAIVYTLWLKRRTCWNIVIGGLAGSFSVLAGAAAANTVTEPMPLILALVLFLWTPPHFWSLAIANKAEYAAAGIPMLPVVVGDTRAARIVFFSTVALVAASLLPILFGAGILYTASAVAGGSLFLWKSHRLVVQPCRQTAMAAFFASLVQLTLLLIAAMVDARLF